MKNLFHISILVLLCALPLQVASSQNIKVYESLGSFEGDINTALANATQLLEGAGMNVLSSFEAGQATECSFGARVISFVDPSMVDQLITLDAKTAPYSIVDRVVLYSDEQGGHIAFVNPQSIYRTVFQDKKEAWDLAGEHRNRVRALFGTTDSHQYGQKRDKGLINRTMGVMAGGPFEGKIETLYTIPNATLASVASRIEQNFNSGEGKWELEASYRYDLNSIDATIFGIAGREMEAKSFSIVGAGSDSARDDFECPGTAYAAAYPLEIIALQVGTDVEIQLVSAMFRMKMYFEDAGKWAFMKNMGMPGSLTSEIKDRIERATANAGN